MIFIIDINKIDHENVFVAKESNIFTTGRSNNCHPPMYIALIIPLMAEIHPMICLIT